MVPHVGHSGCLSYCSPVFKASSQQGERSVGGHVKKRGKVVESSEAEVAQKGW